MYLEDIQIAMIRIAEYIDDFAFVHHRLYLPSRLSEAETDPQTLLSALGR